MPEETTARQPYSGKVTAFKYIGGSLNGFVSSGIAIILIQFFPDMTESDKNYMMLVVIPTLCGLPPAIRHWFFGQKFGRALAWWLDKKYNDLLKSIFKGVPDKILEEANDIAHENEGA